MWSIEAAAFLRRLNSETTAVGRLHPLHHAGFGKGDAQGFMGSPVTEQTATLEPVNME
jgi:hypothetical protein